MRRRRAARHLCSLPHEHEEITTYDMPAGENEAGCDLELARLWVRARADHTGPYRGSFPHELQRFHPSQDGKLSARICDLSWTPGARRGGAVIARRVHALPIADARPLASLERSDRRRCGPIGEPEASRNTANLEEHNQAKGDALPSLCGCGSGGESSPITADQAKALRPKSPRRTGTAERGARTALAGRSVRRLRPFP
jgi:hypothetical protein